jgi:hypothetical protein
MGKPQPAPATQEELDELDRLVRARSARPDDPMFGKLHIAFVNLPVRPKPSTDDDSAAEPKRED